MVFEQTCEKVRKSCIFCTTIATLGTFAMKDRMNLLKKGTFLGVFWVFLTTFERRNGVFKEKGVSEKGVFKLFLVFCVSFV